MVALVKTIGGHRKNVAGTFSDRRRPGFPRLGRAGRIAAHVVGWPLLVKAGAITGFALAASVLRVTGA